MFRPTLFFSSGIMTVLFFCLALFLLFVYLPFVGAAEGFAKLGLTSWQGALMLLAILVGRAFELPIHESEHLVVVAKQRPLGLQQRHEQIVFEQEPIHELKKQIFTLNTGGCLMPILLSVTFLLNLWLQNVPLVAYGWITVALFSVAAGCYALTKVDPMSGLRVPMFLPGIITFCVVYFFVPTQFKLITAYVAGTLGTLLGGNILPLMTPRIRKAVASPRVSIGGAGTFWGVGFAGLSVVFFA